MPRTGSGLGALDDGLEEVEVVGVAGALAGVGISSAAGSGPAKRMSPATRRSWKDWPRVLTYDEIIEGGEKAERRRRLPFRMILISSLRSLQRRDSKLQ